MKFILNIFLITLLSFAFSSCLNKDPVEPTIIIEPPTIQLIGTDTIKTGSYKGFTIGEGAESTYTVVKNFKEPKGKGILYLNVVSNIFTDVSKLEERLPLYQSLFLDEAKGTDSGVQIAFENDKLKSIFLNSGKQLGKWPVEFPASSAIVTGEIVEGVYRKLASISSSKVYKRKFERMSLFTKNVSKNYDSHMTLSPQWYFSTEVDENKKVDVVHLYFKDGVLHSIIVNHFQN